MQKINQFLQESKEEFARVAWPSRKDAIISTIVVLVLSAAFAVAFIGLDFVFAQLGLTVSNLFN